MKTFALQGIDSIVSECMTIGFYRRAIQIKGKIKQWAQGGRYAEEPFNPVDYLYFTK